MMLVSHLKRQHRLLGLDMVAPRTSLVKLVLFRDVYCTGSSAKCVPVIRLLTRTYVAFMQTYSGYN